MGAERAVLVMPVGERSIVTRLCVSAAMVSTNTRGSGLYRRSGSGTAYFHLAPKKLDQNWTEKAKSVVTPRGFEPLLPP